MLALTDGQWLPCPGPYACRSFQVTIPNPCEGLPADLGLGRTPKPVLSFLVVLSIPQDCPRCDGWGGWTLSHSTLMWSCQDEIFKNSPDRHATPPHLLAQKFMYLNFWILGCWALPVLYLEAPSPPYMCMKLLPKLALDSGCLRSPGLDIFQISSNRLHCVFRFPLQTLWRKRVSAHGPGMTFLWFMKSGSNLSDKLWLWSSFVPWLHLEALILKGRGLQGCHNIPSALDSLS